MNPEELIKEIRKEYTGEGLELNDEIRNIFKKNHETLDRALEELSTNLYAKEFHFIMELIQNAEDNSYEKNKEPYLKFILAENHLIIQNNEIGFKEENVRALCDVRKSTKEKVDGYIGEKGIGFKSVFKVSDTPEIHSNGFHFRFHAGKSKKKERLGYILPEFVSDIIYEIEPEFTNIILPFDKKNYKKFSKQLSDIKPNLLLFLKKLKTIHIVNEVDESEMILRKKLLPGDLIELSSETTDYWNDNNEEKYYYRIFAEKVKVPKIYSKDERDNVKQTEIIIGFPLGEENGKYYAETFENCNVHNFLPINDYNFKFIIQADFILTSNRESIDESKGWNKWMLSATIKTIKKSFLQLQKSNLKYNYLDYLPRENDISEDFFKPIVDDLHSWILVNRTLPIKVNRKLEWVKPGKIFHYNKKVITIYGINLIKKRTKYQFLHPLASYTEDILGILGVAEWDWDNDEGCLTDSSWLSSLPLKSREDLYCYLFDEYQGSYFIRKLRNMKILFLIGHKNPVGFNDSDGVFWPLIEKLTFDFLSSAKFIETDYRKSNKVKNVKIKRLFTLIGVKNPNIKILIKEYILPQYEKVDIYDKIGKELKKYHFEFFSFLYKNRSLLKKDKALFDDIRDEIRVCGSDKKFYHINDLFLTDFYDSKAKWDYLFLKKKVSFIDKLYSNCATNQKDLVNVTKFLNSLGVKDTASSDDIINVFESENFMRIRRMLAYLNNNWEVYKKMDEIDSVLINILIPMQAELHDPETLFTDTRSNNYVLGDTVNYVPKYLNNKAFIKALKINDKTIPNDYLLEVLRQAKQHGHGDIDKKHITTIYSKFKNDSELKTTFKDESLLYSFRDKKWLLPWQAVWRVDIDDFSTIYAEFKSQYSEKLLSFFITIIGVKTNIEIYNIVQFLKVISSKERVNEKDRISIEKAIGFIFQNYKNRKVNLEDIESLFDYSIYPNQSNRLKSNVDIYFADDDHINEIFKNEKVSIFKLSESNIGYKNDIISSADELDLYLISSYCKANYSPLKYLRSDKEWTESIKDLLALIGYILYHKSRKDYNELSLYFEEVNKTKLFFVDHLLIDYQIDDLVKPVSEAFFIKKNKIYVNTQYNIKDLIVDIVIRLLHNKPIIKDIVLFFDNEPNELQVSNYLKRFNIPQIPDNMRMFAKEKKKKLREEEIIEIDNELEEVITDDEELEVELKGKSTFKKKESDSSSSEVIEVNVNEWIPESNPDFEVSIKNLVFDYNERQKNNDSYFHKTLANQAMFSRYNFSSNKSYEKEIGDWGEEFVFKNMSKELLRKYSDKEYSLDEVNQSLTIIDNDGKDLVSFENRNTSEGITQSGFDFLLIEENQHFYLEVKSTTRQAKTKFKIEERQWECCKYYKDKFILIIVRNAGSNLAVIERIPNLFGLYNSELVSIKTGSMSLYI